MNLPIVQFTAPVLCRDSAIWFSAYGFGWGYRAFAIPYDAMRACLGTEDLTDQQVRLAFEREQATNPASRRTERGDAL